MRRLKDLCYRCDRKRVVQSTLIGEVDAQVGVGRPVEHMPTHIADTLLDFFDVSLKAGADVSNLG